MKIKEECSICNSKSTFAFNSEYYRIDQCSNPECGHFFVKKANFYNEDLRDSNTLESWVYIKNIEKYLKRNKHLINFLKKIKFIEKGFRVLDIGSGTGHIIQSLLSQLDNLEITAIESSRKLQEYIKSLNLNITLYNTIDQVPKEKQYDAIFMIEVIEHLLDPITVLTEAKKRLKQNGKLFLTTPAGDTREGISDKSKLTAYKRKGHIQFFTERSLKYAISIAGFNKMRYYAVKEFHNFEGELDPDIEEKRKAAYQRYKKGKNQHLTYIIS